MVALVDGPAGFLEGGVLRSAEQMQRADRRVAVAPPEQEAFRGGGRRACAQDLGLVPAGPHQRCENGFAIAHQHDVQRIGLPRPLGIGRTARQTFERLANRVALSAALSAKVVTVTPSRVSLSARAR
jgi:hypothetical protein